MWGFCYTGKMQKYPNLFVWAEKVAYIGLFIIPLLFVRASFFPYTSVKGFLIILIALIVVGLLVTLWIRDRSWKPKMSLPVTLFAIYVGWMVFISLFGKNFSISLWGDFRLGNGLITQIAILLYSFGLLWIAQKKNITKQVAGVLALSGVGVGVYLYADLASPKGSFLHSQALGATLGNSSFAAAYMIAAVTGALLLVVSASNKWKWVWGAVTLFLISNPLFINIFRPHTGILSFVGEARAAVLGLVIAGVVGILFYYSFSNKKILRIVANIAMAIGFIGMTVAGALLYSPKTSLHQTFADLASGNRFIYQDIALEGLALKPLTGFGYGHFPMAYQQLFDPINLGGKGFSAEAWVNEPHNMVIQTGTVGGFPGLIVYLVFLGGVLIFTSYSVRKGFLGKIEGGIFFGFFVAYIIQNTFLFDVPAAQMAFMALVGVMASYGVAGGESSKSSPLISDKDLRSTAIIVVWLGVIAGSYCFVIRPFTESLRIGAMQKQSDYRSAEKIFALTPESALYDETGLIHNRSVIQFAGITKLAPAERKIAVDELQGFKTFIDGIMQKNPDFMRTHIALVYADLALFKASNYEDTQLVQEAQDESMRIIALSPRNQLGYWLMAQSRAFSGHIDSGARFAEMAVQLQSDVLDSHMLLLNILQYSDNTKLFKDRLQRAKKMFPDASFEQFEAAAR